MMKTKDKGRILACEMKFVRSRSGVTKRDRIRNGFIEIEEQLRKEPLLYRIQSSII